MARRLFKPIKASPVLRGFRNALSGLSGTSELRASLEQVKRQNQRLADSLDSTENRLLEATKKLDGKTGIEVGWGFRNKDFSAGTISKLQALAFQAFHGHPLAKKAIRNKRAFVTQEGFKLEATYDGPARDGKTAEEIRELVQEFLDQHWEINWEGRLEKRVDSKIIYGETAFWLPPANELSGQSQAGMIDRDQIEALLPDPLNAERAGTLKLMSPLGFWIDGELKRRDTIPLVRYCWRDQEYKGEVLYWGSNILDTMHRGVTDLSPALDYLELFDQLVWTEGERVKMLRSMLFQWIEKGADPDAIIAKQRQLSAAPPPPGSFQVTNENVEIKEICPTINTAPSLEFIRFLFGLASGCLDMPEHHFYTGGDVNRATAKEMSDPLFASVRDEKESLSQILYAQHAYALQKASRVERSLVYGFTNEELAFQVVSRDPERDAIEVIGKHLLSLTQALLVMTSEGYISKEQAGSIARQEAGALGLGEIEAPDVEGVSSTALNKLELMRSIGGRKESFPLAVGGDPNWAIKKPA